MAVIIISKNTTGLYIGDDTDVWDTILRENDANVNYGSGLSLLIYNYPPGTRHTLLKFDLTSIPAGSTITAATLGLNCSDASASTIQMRKLLRIWVELQATWNIYSTGNSWTTAGGISDGNDRSATITASTAISGTGWKTWSDDQLITDIQAMIDGGANNGWHFQNSSDPNVYPAFVSSDGTDGSRPYLSVTYTAAGGHPAMKRFGGVPHVAVNRGVW
jgi:hypothetical protein